jgi:hypothetical protein
MFGRRQRMEAELLDTVRRELATVRDEVQSTLADAVATLSTRVRTEVEQRVGEPSALVAGIQDVRDSLAARETEVAQMLRRVAETCDALAERVQLDRIERSVLADAVNRLAAALSVVSTVPIPALRSTVLGGTVDPDLASTTHDVEPIAEIDLEAEALRDATPAPVPQPTIEPEAMLTPAPTRELPHDGVEVRCRFGDRWVTGFEVCEVIRFDDVTRYRLRRRSDGSVLPTLFEDKDLRFFTSLAEPQ